jgi:gliding motility-associated-like protein
MAQFFKFRFSVFLWLMFIGFFSFDARSTHILGGEVYYDSLGNGFYKVTFEIYRDCNSATAYDNPLVYTVFYGDGTYFNEFVVDLNSSSILPIVYDDPCVTPPNNICVEKGIYIDTIQLPFNPSGYHISYQRCCWANNVDNIVDPGNNGITLTTFVPGSDLTGVYNQGARFVNYPPLVLCAQNTLNFNHIAFDPDGDSLTYELADPLEGGSIGNIIPNPESPPPYNGVLWNPGFSTFVPFGAGSNITINPQTGMMSFTPNNIGNFVAGVKVNEYRNGILINSKIRTFSFRVVVCQVDIPISVNITGPPQLIEDCGYAGFIISRTDTTENLVVQIGLGGTATNGVDYPFIPDSLVIPVGVSADTISIEALMDALVEDTETVFFSVIVPNPCDGTFDTTSISLNLVDYQPLEIVGPDSLNVCILGGEVPFLTCTVSNGVSPYQYNWEPGPFPNSDSVSLGGFSLQPNENIFYVEVQDVCGKTISLNPIYVYNQCPLEAPNVMTVDGNGVNDVFIVQHLEDYDAVQLRIFNRWGNLIYENEAYQNDWSGTDLSGKKLVDGVYFYTVVPQSAKYTYDDQEKTQFTLHGFVHVLNK